MLVKALNLIYNDNAVAYYQLEFSVLQFLLSLLALGNNLENQLFVVTRSTVIVKKLNY